MRTYSEIYSRLTAMNMVEDYGKIWMALLNRNGLCEIDKETQRAKIREIFDGGAIGSESLYCKVEKVDNYLIFSPDCAEKIAVYNLEQGSMVYIPLEDVKFDYKQSKGEAKFWNIIRHHSDVYLLGYSYPAIIKINIESMEIKYITDWLSEVEENIRNGDTNGYFADGCVICGDLALIPVGCFHAILELNLKTNCTRLVKLDVPMSGIGGIASADGENIWMVGRGNRTNRVCCWNIRKGEIQKYFLEDEDEALIDPFYAPICTDSKVFLMPLSASCIYEIDVDTNEIKKSEILKNQFHKLKAILSPYWKTMAPQLQGDWLTFLTCDNPLWYSYNIRTGKLQSTLVYIEEDIRDKVHLFDSIYIELKKETGIVPEIRVPLEYFVEKVTKEGDEGKKNLEVSIGENLYKQICRYVEL